MSGKTFKIVYTDQETFEEPVIEVHSRLIERQITEIVGHDDWDYVADDVPVTHVVKPKKGIAAVVSATALLLLLIPPVSAEWRSPWPTEWVEVENTFYRNNLYERRSLTSSIASDRLSNYQP